MPDREHQLEWESAQRMRAAISSIVAGVVLVAGALYGLAVIQTHDPAVGLIQGLSPALHGLARAAVDPHTARERFTDNHAAAFILAAIFNNIGMLAIVPMLLYLHSAVRFRRPETSQAAKYLAIGGPVAAAIFGIAAEIIFLVNAHRYITHTDRSHHALTQAVSSAPQLVLSTLATFGLLALTAALIMVSIGAIRTGLLSRFLGYVGVFGGILFIVPFFPIPAVQAFWLVGVGIVLAGVGDIVLPPAWAAGEAQPWPKSQGRADARERGRGNGRPTAEPAPAPAVPTESSPHASKKRKRRR